MATLKHPIQEAERYLENAKTILLEKAEKDGDYYNVEAVSLAVAGFHQHSDGSKDRKFRRIVKRVVPAIARNLVVRWAIWDSEEKKLGDFY